jgi:signal transduction histidine kinase
MGAELFFINLAATLCVLFFVGLVVRSGLSTLINRRFIYFLIALLGWLIFNYFSNQTFLSHDMLFAINRLVFVAAVFAIATMLRFCLTTLMAKTNKIIDTTIWIVTGMASVLALTPYVVESITAQGSVVGITFAWGSGIYFMLLALLAIGVIVALFYGSIKAKGIERARARALFAAFGVGLIVVTVTNVILPAIFDLFYLSAAGSLVVVILLVGVGYSIVKYQLFDIRLFVARSLAYIFVITFLAIIYSIITFGFLSQLTDQSISLAHEIPYFLTALFLGFTFWPMKNYFNKVSDRIFYKDNYDIQDVLNRFSNLILGEVRLDSLLDGALHVISDSLKSDFGKIILINEKGGIMGGSGYGVEPKIDKLHIVDDLLKPDKDVLIVDGEDMAGLKRKNRSLYSALKAMRTGEIQVAVRLKTLSSGSIGYILLGQKRNGGSYTDQDVRLLGLVCGELAVAVENSLRFEEIKNFNETLQGKVDSATHRLQRANTQLQRLDEAKDEFVSMASHQLRTPLTSVKGYISMVLEGDVGKITSTQRQLLGEAFTSSERMVHLINDFLNVSRLQTGKFMLERRKVDLAKVVSQEVESLQTTAKAHDLTLKYRRPSYFPVLYVDENKLRQVMMNFIDNAIYYSHEGTTIDVKLEIVEGDAVLTVHDTGIGVPKSEQAHLFGKFFRATNARKQRPDGTGVGLFLAKKVVDAHGGSMVFESVEDEGSTFGFRLPVKKLSSAPKDDADKLDN